MPWGTDARGDLALSLSVLVDQYALLIEAGPLHSIQVLLINYGKLPRLPRWLIPAEIIGGRHTCPYMAFRGSDYS